MQVTLKMTRLAFAQIWEAKPFQTGATPKFNASFLFDPKSPNVKLVQDAIQQVAKEKWKDKAASTLESLKGNPNKFCFLNGNTKPEYEGFPGNLFVRSSSTKRPTILDRDKTPLTQAEGRPYSGCYVNAIVDIWAQDNQYGKGVQCTLLGLQFVKDGDAFGGGTSVSADDFEDMSDGADAPDVGSDASAAGGGFV